MSLTTPTEQQAHDAQIAELGFQRAKAQANVDQLERDRDSESSYRRSYFDAGDYAAAQAKVEALDAKLEPLHEAYTGWPRYYHVTNANGHVHTSTSCSSCFYDTFFSWRTDLSGFTSQEVVDREAHNACSVCMPIAPVEQRQARERYNAEQRAARAAEKTAKANEKLAKAAVRAQKLIVKVEAAMAQMTREGTREAFLAIYSDHGHDGKLSTYNYCMNHNVPSTVEGVLMDMQKRARGERGWNKDPYAIVAEATEKGLL